MYLQEPAMELSATAAPRMADRNVSTLARLRVRLAKMRMDLSYEVEHNRHDSLGPACLEADNPWAVLDFSFAHNFFGLENRENT